MTTALFARTDRTIIGRWWWQVDRWILAALLSLLAIGVILIAVGSTGVANTIQESSFHFVTRHLLFAPMAAVTMLSLSLIGPKGVRNLAILLFAGTVVLLLAVPFIGSEAKGAVRWIRVVGFSLQPSEFVKPALAVLAAWLFYMHQKTGDGRWLALNLAALAVAVALIVSQPDIGMAVVIVAVWGVQFFLAGMPVPAVIGLAALGIGGLAIAYHLFPHVESRVNRFLNPGSGDTYQVDMSLSAIQNGGAFGVGAGQGELKERLPDAHADFIFAVAGEEFGLFLCLLLIGLIGFVFFRGMIHVAAARSAFAALAIAGLLMSFAFQALVNMGSALNVIPAKGMTLPFVSYGGSSMLSVAIAMSFLLALTRRRMGYDGEDDL